MFSDLIVEEDVSFRKLKSIFLLVSPTAAFSKKIFVLLYFFLSNIDFCERISKLKFEGSKE